MNSHAREVAAILEVVGQHFAASHSDDEIAKMTASFDFASSALIYLVQKMGWKGRREARDADHMFSHRVMLWEHATLEERVGIVKNIVENVQEVPF